MLNLFDISDADITEAYGLKVHGRQPNVGVRNEERRRKPMARRGSSRNAELRTTRSVCGGQRRSTANVEQYFKACFRGHQYNLGAEEEEGREGRSSEIQSSSGRLWKAAKAQSARVRRRAHPQNICPGGTIGNIQGTFEGDDGEVFVRPPPDERFFDDRGVPIVWKLLKPLYGEADAGRIWHRTAKKQLVQTQGFTQSEFDPCYFFKKYSDGHRVDLI
eukprot:5781913-Pleurochrysis_carterae.AAC.1